MFFSVCSLPCKPKYHCVYTVVCYLVISGAQLKNKSQMAKKKEKSSALNSLFRVLDFQSV